MGKGRVVPYVVMTVVDPKILEVLGLVRSVLEASEQDDIILHILGYTNEAYL